VSHQVTSWSQRIVCGTTLPYQWFIQDFSHHAWPLFDLTSKNAPWTWGEAQQTAFNELKCAVTSQLVLMFADDARPFRIKADSSNFATGTVLSQQSTMDKKWHLVAFLSKSLNMVEWNYEIHDKEMLTIIHSSLRFGLTTKTWTTSGQHRNSTGSKHNGPSTYPNFISCYTTNPEEAWANWTHFPNMQTMVMGAGTTRTSPSSDWNCLQFVLSKA
jgi:hypothetical protein